MKGKGRVTAEAQARRLPVTHNAHHGRRHACKKGHGRPLEEVAVAPVNVAWGGAHGVKRQEPACTFILIH
jgi:hypothetical protein